MKNAVATIDHNVPAVLTPMEMLSRATANGASIEVLEKLMTLQERYEKNEARKAFDEAISAAKSEIGPISKNRDGHNYRYADIATITNAAVPIMSANGLSHRYRISQTDRISVTCVISHKLGHYEETTLAGSPDKTGSKNDIQSIGSTVTYLQRYTLIAALGLSIANDDTDGAAPEANGAKRHETLPKAKAKTTYAKLQVELDSQPTVAELEKWGAESAERIKLMPEDWQDILRLRYQERMLEFKQGVEKDEPPRSNEGLVKWVDGVLSGVKDPGLLEPTWNMKVEPYMIDLPEATIEAISGLYRRHEARLAP